MKHSSCVERDWQTISPPTDSFEWMQTIAAAPSVPFCMLLLRRKNFVNGTLGKRLKCNRNFFGGCP
jgi:hypothetical protein